MPDAKITLTAVDQTKATFRIGQEQFQHSMGQAANLAQSIIGKITGPLLAIGSVAGFKTMVDGVIQTKVELARLLCKPAPRSNP